MEATTNYDAPPIVGRDPQHEGVARWLPGRTQPAHYSGENTNRVPIMMNYVSSYDAEMVTDNNRRDDNREHPSPQRPGTSSPPRFAMRRLLSNHLGPQFGHTVRTRTVHEW